MFFLVSGFGNKSSVISHYASRHCGKSRYVFCVPYTFLRIIIIIDTIIEHIITTCFACKILRLLFIWTDQLFCNKIQPSPRLFCLPIHATIKCNAGFPHNIFIVAPRPAGSYKWGKERIPWLHIGIAFSGSVFGSRKPVETNTPDCNF